MLFNTYHAVRPARDVVHGSHVSRRIMTHGRFAPLPLFARFIWSSRVVRCEINLRISPRPRVPRVRNWLRGFCPRLKRLTRRGPTTTTTTAQTLPHPPFYSPFVPRHEPSCRPTDENVFSAVRSRCTCRYHDHGMRRSRPRRTRSAPRRHGGWWGEESSGTRGVESGLAPFFGDNV